MRASKLGRWTGRAVFVLAVGIGVSGLAGSTASAEVTWDIAPKGAVSTPNGGAHGR